MVPYSVYTPPFDVTSGGIRVMWGLYGWLLAKGQIAYVNQYPADGNCIAIYPEIVQGNPFNAKKVVRYILNKPGVMGGTGPDGTWRSGQTTFDPSDKLYVFSELFNTVGARADHHLFLPILDMHLWRDEGLKRTKQAVFIGKGKNKNFHPLGCVPIDRNTASDQKALADLLNECEVMYCYDPVTAMTEIARLCGCRVVMINDVYTKDEFRNYEPGMNGITWWGESTVPLDSKGFRNHYINLRIQFSSRLDKFIDDTQK